MRRLALIVVATYLASLVGCMNDHRIGHPPDKTTQTTDKR